MALLAGLLLLPACGTGGGEGGEAGSGTEAGAEPPTAASAETVRLSQALAALEGVDSAHVLLSGDQAFVAVAVRETAGGSPGPLRIRVEQRLRSLAPAVRQVYVAERSSDVRPFTAFTPASERNATPDEWAARVHRYARRLLPDRSYTLPRGNVTLR